MCNGTFQHNFQPLEKETEIAINTLADPELQIGVCVCVYVCVCVCVGRGGGGEPVISGGGGRSQDPTPGCPLKCA